MGSGRKKGVPNKITRDVRMTIALVAEANAPKINGWLARVGKRDPGRAMELYLRMLEYHIPKLTRTEIVKPPAGGGRVIDSSKLTAEEREQMRQIILRQMQQAEPQLLEQQPSNLANFVAPSGEFEPAGLGDAQVVDSVDEHGSTGGLDR